MNTLTTITEAPPMYGTFHITFVLCSILVSFLAAKFFCRKEKKTVLRFLCVLGWILLGMEAGKQYFYYHLIQNDTYNWWWFPFQLCSVPMYLCILLPLLKGKAQDAVCTFLYSFVMVACICAFALPQDMLRPYAIMTWHSFLWHGILLVISTVSFACRLPGRFWTSFRHACFLFLGLAGIAEVFNILGTHLSTSTGTYPDLFYINPYTSTTQPVYATIQALFGRPAEIIFYLCMIMCAAGLLHFLYLFRTKKRS